jgi:hypothetical protein
VHGAALGIWLGTCILPGDLQWQQKQHAQGTGMQEDHYLTDNGTSAAQLAQWTIMPLACACCSMTASRGKAPILESENTTVRYLMQMCSLLPAAASTAHCKGDSASS